MRHLGLPLTIPQVSVALATGVFLKALHQRANFYAACVYLSQSNANLMVSPPLSLPGYGTALPASDSDCD